MTIQKIKKFLQIKAAILLMLIILIKIPLFILESMMIHYESKCPEGSCGPSEETSFLFGFLWWIISIVDYYCYPYLMFLLIFSVISATILRLYINHKQNSSIFLDLILFVFFFAFSWALVDQSGIGKLKYRGETVSHYFPDRSVRTLANAAAKGDITAIDAAMAAGADINYESDSDDVTPLFWAMHAGSKKGFEKLLDLGADPRQGDRVIREAASGPDAAYLEILLEHGLDPNRTSGRFDEPLIFEAIDGGRWPQVRLLLKHCYNLNWSNEWGQTAAWMAVMRHKLDMAVEFIVLGQNFQLERVALAIEQRGESLRDKKSLEKLVQLLETKGVNLPIDKARVTEKIGQASVSHIYAESCVKKRQEGDR